MTKETVQKYLSLKDRLLSPVITGMVAAILVDNYAEFCDEAAVEAAVSGKIAEEKVEKIALLEQQLAELKK